jgi:sugar lactone lactonase YvrE
MGLDYEDFPTPGALASETPLHHASDIEMDPQGRLFVAGNHAPLVFRVGTDNRVQIVAGNENFSYSGDGGPATEAETVAPFGVLPLPDGSFYFSDLEAHVVRYVDPQGIIHTVAGTGERGDGGDGGPGTEARLNSPTRLRLDGQGRLYICDTDNHAIRRLDADGLITTVVGTGTLGYSGDGGPANLAMIHTPYDVRFAPSGDLYFADTGNNVIRKVDADGILTTVVGTGVPGFAGDEGDARTCQLDRPSGVIFDGDGNLWISDTFNQRVRRVTGILALHDE